MNKLNAQNIKVFILAGQSNMQGHGDVFPENVSGTLSNFMASSQSEPFNYLQDSDGTWAERQDVWVRYDHENGNLLADVLGIGFGSSEEQIGPELGFGHLLGEHSDDQVLIIKTCWGGKSLAVDFRPPSSGGTVGPYYNQMITDISNAISNISTEFPQFIGGQVEIAGFCWFQGWNDGEEDAYLNEYEENLKNLISDVRAELNTPDLPIVIGLTGNGGFTPDMADLWVFNLQTILVPAQINAAEFTGHDFVSYAETRSFWIDGNASPEPDFVHHWKNNAESYLRIGNEFGLEMIQLLDQINAAEQTIITNKRIEISPIPTIDYLRIQGEFENANVKIFDINKRIVLSYLAISSGQQVDISMLTDGIFFVHILDNSGKTISVNKIIKTK